MRPADKLTDGVKEQLEQLCQRCPDLATIRDLARGFAVLVRTRGGTRLPSWVEHAEQCAIAELRCSPPDCARTGTRSQPG